MDSETDLIPFTIPQHGCAHADTHRYPSGSCASSPKSLHPCTTAILHLCHSIIDQFLKHECLYPLYLFIYVFI